MIFVGKWLLNANKYQMQMICKWLCYVNKNDFQIITIFKCKWFANNNTFELTI